LSSLPPECERLVEALDRATAWLAGLDRHDAGQVEHALAERLDAIEALTQWIAAEQQASRPVNPRLAAHLTKDLEAGAEILLRLALDREVTRADILDLNRELQMLRGLTGAPPTRLFTIDCLG